jgi:hypothetical protein
MKADKEWSGGQLDQSSPMAKMKEKLGKIT